MTRQIKYNSLEAEVVRTKLSLCAAKYPMRRIFVSVKVLKRVKNIMGVGHEKK